MKYIPKDRWRFNTIYNGLADILMAVGTVGLVMKAIYNAAKATGDMSYAIKPPESLDEYDDAPFEEN